ncbi:hypothetical protein V5O48_016907 [Marasmius crinis-equi]|uniref:Uncharacterized protein n=1 Tax=Marasmius crinis-equi TaxID=585013 RepID=A0ABR3EQF9_9AGAR
MLYTATYVFPEDRCSDEDPKAKKRFVDIFNLTPFRGSRPYLQQSDSSDDDSESLIGRSESGDSKRQKLLKPRPFVLNQPRGMDTENASLLTPVKSLRRSKSQFLQTREEPSGRGLRKSRSQQKLTPEEPSEKSLNKSRSQNLLTPEEASTKNLRRSKSQSTFTSEVPSLKRSKSQYKLSSALEPFEKGLKRSRSQYKLIKEPGSETSEKGLKRTKSFKNLTNMWSKSRAKESLPPTPPEPEGYHVDRPVTRYQMTVSEY